MLDVWVQDSSVNLNGCGVVCDAGRDGAVNGLRCASIVKVQVVRCDEFRMSSTHVPTMSPSRKAVCSTMMSASATQLLTSLYPCEGQTGLKILPRISQTCMKPPRWAHFRLLPHAQDRLQPLRLCRFPFAHD